MTRSGRKPMGVDPRWIARAQKRGVRGDLIKRLAELIKNADDAYDRLELKGEKTSGIIEVAYNKMKIPNAKGFSIRGFFIRDFGSGMSPEKVKESYHSDTNYGSDTSDETRNGAIGVGGKECFYGVEDCLVLTVHDGVLTVVDIGVNQDQRLDSEIIEGSDTKQIMEMINNQITKGGLVPISLTKNQTLAMFRLPDAESGARPDTLAEQLRTFYTLRWIMESNSRTVKLIDLANSQTQLLKHTPISGELLFEKMVTIPFNNVPYQVKIEFNKSENDLIHNHSFGDGILIQTGRGAILDNQMYGFENDSAATKLYGKVIFNDWKKLYRESNGIILTDNREGLDYNHAVNRVLQNYILTYLKPLIDDEREKQGDNPELDRDLDNHIKRAFDFMNKMISKKSTNTTIQLLTTPPDGIEFESGSYTITEKKPKKIKLYLNPSKVPTNSIISLSLIGNGITINPNSAIATPLSYDSNQNGVFDSSDEVPFVEIEVTGKELVNGKETRTTLKAIFGDLEAETEIYVKNETSLYPTNGFEFRPKKTIIVPKKDRRIKLVIDTNLIDAGTVINITCDDDRIKIFPVNITVTLPPNLGKYLTEEVLTLSSTKIGIKTKITAETITKNGESRTSICEIEVKEKEPPKTFFKDYKLDKKGDRRVRSRFKRDEGIIYIHVNAPILQWTFGKEQQHLDNNDDDAVSLLADTIVDRMTLELAKFNVETGEVDVLDDEATAIEVRKGDLEFQFGLHLLQTIINGHASHDDD